MAKLSKIISKSVIFNGDKVLLVKRSSTAPRRPLQWDMPGGNVDDGEDFVAAVQREVIEEVDIDIPREDFHLVYAAKANDRQRGNVVWLYFVSRTDKTKVTLSYEHEAFEWVSLDKALELFEYPLQLDVINYIKDNNLLPPR